MKKKMSFLLCAMLVCTLLAGCGKKEPLQGETQKELSVTQDTQIPTENQGRESAEALLDKFLAGEINAEGNDLYFEDSFNISDLPMDVEDWQSYSVGERLDLDNDGENEQILNGPYGGMYLDASDGKVKVFANGEGTVRNLFYMNYEGEVWIAYSDITHMGRACYFFEKYNGADNVVEAISLERYSEEDGTTYYLNGKEVSLSIYADEYEKFFGPYEESDAFEAIEILDESVSVNDLYEAFLRNETSVANPYVEGDVLSVMSDEDYDGEFDGAQKKYAFVDVNMDDEEELIFKISAYPSELMLIVGVYNDELICFDVMETHTSSMAFGVYDYGLVWQDENYEHFLRELYSYTTDGKPSLVRTFTEASSEADMAAHEGNDLEWIDWESFSGL